MLWRLPALPCRHRAYSPHRTPHVLPPDRPGSAVPQQGDSIQAEIGLLSLSAMAESTGERRSQPQATPLLSFQTLFRSVTSVSGEQPVAIRYAQSLRSAGLLGTSIGLCCAKVFISPALRRVRCLTEFLSLSLPCLPYVDKTQLTDEYAHVVRCHETGDVDNLLENFPGRAVRVYSAVSIGILLSQDHRHMESFATVLSLSARQHMSRVFTSANNLEMVQCLVGIAVYSLFSAFGGPTWHLLGLAMTRCLSAGMHHIRVSDPQSDDGDKKGCSRVFWCLYILDAYVPRL